MGYKYKFTDNSDKLMKQLEGREIQILNEWGKLWQSIATKLVTKNKAVDTGRLRASLSYLVYTGVGQKNPPVPETVSSDYLSGKASKKNELVVGSNLPYAKYIELGSGGKVPRPFIKPAFLEYKRQYEKLAEQILKRGN